MRNTSVRIQAPPRRKTSLATPWSDVAKVMRYCTADATSAMSIANTVHWPACNGDSATAQQTIAGATTHQLLRQSHGTVSAADLSAARKDTSTSGGTLFS